MNKNFHIIISTALLLCVCFSVSQVGVGVPAYPGPTVVSQPDGTTFSLRLHGDEYFSWHTTADGYVVAKDPADGYWKYAQPKKGEAALEVIRGAVVGKVNPTALNIQKGALPAPELRQQQLKKRRVPGNTGFRPSGMPSATVPSGAPAPTLAPEPPIGSGPLKIPVSGATTIKNVVILACFSDHWDSTNGTVLPSFGRVNTNEYSNLFNEVGHTNDGAVGSVRDYYNEVSYGNLTVVSVVSPWVQLPNNEAYYGANVSGQDVRPDVMAADAIAAAEAAGFDFSQGDSDGDGWVDCLTIIHSGFGEELVGNPANCIWSHQWTMPSVATYDGKKMYRYHTEPALRGLQGVSTSIIRIGVICHEMGHFFGLPDLYDYSDATWGLGKWCLMAFGSWNGGDGKSPAHFSAYCKCSLGFVVPEIVHARATQSLPRVEDNPSVHMIRDGTSNGEYFLVENRGNYGFDNDVTSIYPGILIYHVDSKSKNNDLSTWPHPLVKIEEADGNNSLGNKTALSEPGDVWHSGSGLPTGFVDTTGVQSTNAMMYQSLPYNRADNPAYYSYVQLMNFSAAGNPMTYTLATLKPTVETQTAGPPTPPSFSVSWGACTNATHFEIQEGTTVTLTSFLDSAEDEDTVYQNWTFGGTATRSAAGAAMGSYSFAMEYGSSVQTVTMRQPFKLLASTNVSFYVMSHIVTGNGYMRFEISNNGGATWHPVATYSGYIDPWAAYSYNAATLTGAGVSLNDWCLLRFVANTEYGFGWSSFPAYGFAFDHVSITGTEMNGYGNWVSLNNNVPVTSYLVSGKPNGTYAYRVRAFANAAWQGFGQTGEVLVVPVVLSLFGLE